MPEFLITIDNILQNIFVRWALLFATVILLTGVGIQTVRLTATSLQLKAANGSIAEYAAKLAQQNDAIKKAADDMQTLKLQVQTANAKAADLAVKLKKRQVEIREIILQGTCPEMVQQVVDEVRK